MATLGCEGPLCQTRRGRPATVGPLVLIWRDKPLRGPLLRSHSQGANPADTPIELVAKFELVINLKAARVFGLTIAVALVARADEVIR